MKDQERYPGTYEGLVRLLQRLRGPEGCPWDKEQTRGSMARLFLEESYELIEAIEQGDKEKLVDELGDVLFHVLFQIQIGEEAGELTRDQVLQSLVDKLIRRHPHIFGDASAGDAREVEANWEAVKQREREATDASMLDGVPKQMPALSYAQAVQVRAARVGFDWDEFSGVLEKVTEELAELEGVESHAEREGELGDILFSIVNAARWLGVDPEAALRGTNAGFYRRFAAMERLSRERGLSFPDLPLDEKEALWQEAKGLVG